MAERKTAIAKAIGDKFHDATEDLVWGKEVGVDDRRLHGMLLRTEEFIKSHGFVPLHTELHVVSHKYVYQGTLDAIGTASVMDPKTLKVKRMLVLVDWKTSSGIYPDMALQLVAYAEAYFEQTDERIDTGLIVHVSKDKPHHKLTIKRYKLGKRLFTKFLKRLKEYREYNDTVTVKGEN